MTVREFYQNYQGSCLFEVWAADTRGGFGNKGDTAYGYTDNCDVVHISFKELRFPMRRVVPVLHIWHSCWGPCPE